MVAQPFWVKVKPESTDLEILGVLPKLQSNMNIYLTEGKNFFFTILNIFKISENFVKFYKYFLGFMVTALKKIVLQQRKLMKS